MTPNEPTDQPPIQPLNNSQTQGALTLEGAAALPCLLRPFTRWDAAHFLSIAQAGHYPSLPSHAFFPLYPALVRGCARLLSCLSLSPSSAPSPPTLVAAALLVTHISFLVATLSLYQLTRRVLVDGGGGGPQRATRSQAQRQQGGERVAYLAALLYICSPASIFYTTAYSEVGGYM